ncbi:MAG TPA: hypothetical protein VI300_19780, partial [Solirubrobacter sp.]
MSRFAGTEALVALRRLGFAAALALLWCSPAHADLPAGQFVIDGTVTSLTRAPDGTVYAAGGFSQQQRPTGSGLIVSATGSGTPDTAQFPAVVGDVNAVVADGAGGWYVGGTFKRIGSLDIAGLAHVNGDGSVDPGFNPGAGEVDALAISGSTLYVGGSFNHMGGADRLYLAALDTDTGLATGWNPGADAPVTSLASVGSTIYVGGWFSSVGGQPRSYVAAVDAITGAIGTFHPALDGAVFAVTASASTVYVGGQFHTVNGQPREGFAAFDAATSGMTGFDPAPQDSVVAMALVGATLYIGGRFDAPASLSTIRAFDTITGAATAFDPGVLNNSVRSLAVAGGTVYAGGWFTDADGHQRHNAAAFDAGTGALRNWDPNVGGEVSALAVTGARVYVGGHFAGAGPPLARIAGVVHLQADGSLDTTWNPRVEGYVMAVLATSTTVYVSGAFSSAGGASRYDLAAIDAKTGDATSWNPTVDWNIDALALSGRTLYVGGSFFKLNGQPRQFIGALDTVTSATTSWYPGPADANVYALAVSGKTVYAAGSFSGRDRAGVAAFDASTGAVLPWNPAQGTRIGVAALVPTAGLVYIAGGFTSLGGLPRSNLAALDSSGSPTSWAPVVSTLWGSAAALAIDGTTAYVGGTFPAVGGYARANLAAVDTQSGAPSSWYPAPNATVNAITAAGHTVIAGGSFTVAAGQITGGLATFDLTPPRTSFTTAPSGFTNDPTPKFAFASSKPGSTFDCALNTGYYGACAFSAFPDGTYTVAARATDRTGLQDPSPPRVTFTVDTVPPDTSATAGPPVTFGSSESGSSYTCSIDGAAFAPCTSPFVVTDIAPGEHRLAVAAIDAAGNVDPTPAEIGLSVSAPPAATATPQPSPTPTQPPAKSSEPVLPMPLTAPTSVPVTGSTAKSKTVRIPFRGGYSIGNIPHKKG